MGVHIPITDDSGREIVRSAITRAGWTYHAKFFDFETSKLGSLTSKGAGNADDGWCTYTMYDSGGNSTLVDADCVHTRVSFRPLQDREVVGATIRVLAETNEDVYVDGVGSEHIPANLGGTKVMVSGLNLKFLKAKEEIETNGRSPKMMEYETTYNSDIINVNLYHNAGVNVALMVRFDIYKE